MILNYYATKIVFKDIYDLRYSVMYKKLSFFNNNKYNNKRMNKVCFFYYEMYFPLFKRIYTINCLCFCNENSKNSFNMYLKVLMFDYNVEIFKNLFKKRYKV